MTLTAGPGEDGDSHLLLLYGDERHRQASVGSWVERGLYRGDKILYATVSDDSVSVSQWRPGGESVTRAVRDGRFLFLPLEEFFPGAEQAALVRGALAEGYPGVRLVAQADAALSIVGDETYQSIDRAMDELCASLPVWALCQYDTARNDHHSLTAAVDSHLDAIQDAEMRLRRRGDHVALAGEVDLDSAESLTRALSKICGVGDLSRMVVLDVSALTFIDVVGCRALVAGTDRLRRAGGTVSCQGASGRIRKVMSMLEVDRIPGMAVV
jgi:anti-anti-sigma factor